VADGHGLSELLATPFFIPTGPLYLEVHAGAALFNGFAVPEIRYINLAALTGCWSLTGYVLHLLGYTRYLTRSAAVIGVPMILAVVGRTSPVGPDDGHRYSRPPDDPACFDWVCHRCSLRPSPALAIESTMPIFRGASLEVALSIQ
jgi:hypothetical protein